MVERSLDLDAVEAFVRIAELGSFTRAAEAMGTAQAAMSMKLKRLEDRLGCRLIERTPRHVQLSAGVRLFWSTHGGCWPRTIARWPRSPRPASA